MYIEEDSRVITYFSNSKSIITLSWYQNHNDLTIGFIHVSKPSASNI